jgi:hypothetical protein
LTNIRKKLDEQLAIIQSSLYNFILFCDCATPLIENELPHLNKKIEKRGKTLNRRVSVAYVRYEKFA